VEDDDADARQIAATFLREACNVVAESGSGPWPASFTATFDPARPATRLQAD
jgi:hypothetical protein